MTGNVTMRGNVMIRGIVMRGNLMTRGIVTMRGNVMTVASRATNISFSPSLLLLVIRYHITIQVSRAHGKLTVDSH